MSKLALVLALLVGCNATTSATVKKDVATIDAAFATCAKADIGQAVANAPTLIAGVIAIVLAGSVDWAAQLDALALKVGDDSLACAVDAIEAMLSPPSAGSGAVGAPNVPALNRLRSYRSALSARHALGKAYQASK